MAEAVISRPGSQEPKKGLPDPPGDNRSAGRGEIIASPVARWLFWLDVMLLNDSLLCEIALPETGGGEFTDVAIYQGLILQPDSGLRRVR